MFKHLPLNTFGCPGYYLLYCINLTGGNFFNSYIQFAESIKNCNFPENLVMIETKLLNKYLGKVSLKLALIIVFCMQCFFKHDTVDYSFFKKEITNFICHFKICFNHFYLKEFNL